MHDMTIAKKIPLFRRAQSIGIWLSPVKCLKYVKRKTWKGKKSILVPLIGWKFYFDKVARTDGGE